MKIAFTGSQHGMTPKQVDELRELLRAKNPSTFIHGACIGADNQADEVAAELGIFRVAWPSTKTAKRVPDEVLRARRGSKVLIMMPDEPLLRNPRIVTSGDLLVACPRQAREIMRSGTWTTVRIGRRLLGVKSVMVIEP